LWKNKFSKVILMLIVIRDGKEVSLKTRFIIQLIGLRSQKRLFYVFRNYEEKFSETWHVNQVELATSTQGILAYFLLMILKSPKDLKKGLINRVFHKNREHVLVSEGFMSIFSEVLTQYFGMTARADSLISFLSKLNSSKIFLIDEFWSVKTLDLKLLKRMGTIIYVSQDLAFNRFGFGDNFITKKLMYKLERDAVAMSDIVVTCSERDQYKYEEIGAKKTVFYPNIYPLAEFEPGSKDPTVGISIVLRGHWGVKAERSLAEIFKAFSYLDEKIKIYLIGIEPKHVPKNVDLQHYSTVPHKIDYLNILSKSWIGINIGIHMGGTNERKYDYAMAGLVIFSDNLGARGDLLPYEYTYVDYQDLAAKLQQLLQFGKDRLMEMGAKNREQALYLAEKQRVILLKTINDILIHNR
jgi:hypothetical protein